MNTVSRRQLTRGVAWAAPAVLAPSQVPVFAASVCPSTAQIDAFFAAQRQKALTYEGCAGVSNPTFTIWYDGPGGFNGYLQNSFINIRNENNCSDDTSQYPLAFRVDVRNLTGPDTNTYGGNTLQRSLTATDSRGYLVKPSKLYTGSYTGGVKNDTNFEVNGTDGAGHTVYSTYWMVDRNRIVRSGEDIDLQFSWGDGNTVQGRLTNSYRVVPLGMLAPTWAELTDYDFAQCPERYAYFNEKVNQWYTENQGCAQNITWQVATNVTVTSFNSTTGYTKTPIACGTGIWSDESKDFTPAHDGIY